MAEHATATSFFARPGGFLAWGLKHGQWSPEELVRKAADAGFKWLCQQVGDPTNQPSPAMLEGLRQACHLRALSFGIWEWNPRNSDRLVGLNPDFWVANVEHPDPVYATLAPMLRKHRPDPFPMAVITNDDLDPKPWIKANFKAIPEAYQVDNPNATPANMVGQCRRMGWRKVFPCVGVYHDYALARYALRWAHGLDGVDGYSVYLLETMTPDDWKTAASWNNAKT